jgi:hypothetical protein
MSSDIILEKDSVRILGKLQVDQLSETQVLSFRGTKWTGSPSLLVIKAQDFLVTYTPNELDPTKMNIALSHMPGDLLVVNRGKGYAGGVKIEGTTEIDELKVGGVTIRQSEPSSTVKPLQPSSTGGPLRPSSTGSPLQHLTTDNLTITESTILIETTPTEFGVKMGLKSTVLDLVAEIKRLSAKVLELENKLTASTPPH